jgi:hypothetical protein
MTPELEKYYETYFDLFTTDGWKQFIEDIQESAKTFDVRNVPDEKALKFVQGQLLIMDKLLNWEASVEVAYNQVKEESEE